MTYLFAFLHHIAAFALVATLVLEFVLVRDELTLSSARKLRFADMALGISAGVVLVAGVMRVFWFEKGAAYYFHSVPFIAKITLFVTIALLSIYPTRVFLSWKKPLQAGQVPSLESGRRRTIRTILHVELVAVALLILCAVLMARGVGYIAWSG
ncbi:MAG: DUF2214 family protein [Gammaproteobacteria bacterium]